MPTIPVFHQHSHPGAAVRSSSVEYSSFGNVSGIKVIGSSSSHSTYILSSNLTVMANSTLELINTDMIFPSFRGAMAYLSVLGNLSMENSTISQESAGYSYGGLSINVSGTSHANATLAMNSSALDMNGSLSSTLATITMFNSTVETSGMGHVATYFNKSDVLLENSTVEGYEKTSSAPEYEAGNETIATSPFASIGNIPFNAATAGTGNAYVNRIHVNLTYTGITYGNSSYMLFNISGTTVYRYIYSSTNGNHNKTTVAFSFPVVNPVRESLLLGSGLTVFFSEVPYNTTITVYGMNVEAMSNDTVDRAGTGSFGPSLSHSTMYSVDSGIDVNYAADSTYRNIPNPMKNAFFLTSSSLVLAGTYATDPGSSFSRGPFEINSSSVAIYSMQEIRDASYQGPVKNASNIVRPSGLNSTGNSFATSHNSFMRKYLASHGYAVANSSSSGTIMLPLLRTFTDGNGSAYYGDYSDTVDGRNFFFSEYRSPGILNRSAPVSLNLKLPGISGNVTHGRIIEGRPGNITFSVSSRFAPVNNLTAFVNITGEGGGAEIIGIPLNISRNGTFTRQIKISSFGSVEPGHYNLTLSFSSGSIVYNTRNLLSSSSVTVHSNVALSVNVSYSLQSGGRSVSMSVKVHNRGGSAAPGTMVYVRFRILDSGYGHHSYSVNVAGDSNAVRNFTYQSTGRILDAEVHVSPAGGVLPYNSSSDYRNITFPGAKPMMHNLTIMEDGLPPGTSWHVTVNGTEYGSSTSAIRLQSSSPQGVYVHDAGGFRPRSSFHELNSSDGYTTTVTFIQAIYTVRFSTSGWSNTTTATLTVGGQAYSMGQNGTALNLSNGQYSYTVSTKGTYRPDPSSGTFTVDNGNVTISIAMVPVQGSLRGDLLHALSRYYPLVLAGAGAVYLAFRTKERTVETCTKCEKGVPRLFHRCPGMQAAVEDDDEI